MFIYSSHGKWVFPPSPVEFFSHHHFCKLSRSWLLGMCDGSCLLQLACLFTVPWGITPPCLFGVQGAPPSLLRVFFVVVYYSVSLFSLDGGRSVQGAMLIWPRIVCGSTTCRLAHLVSVSSQAVWALASGSAGALLVSPFNMKWGCYVWPGGVEESKFCLFLVAFPIRSILYFLPHEPHHRVIHNIAAVFLRATETERKSEWVRQKSVILQSNLADFCHTLCIRGGLLYLAQTQGEPIT
jgi:hypothetical protein